MNLRKETDEVIQSRQLFTFAIGSFVASLMLATACMS